MVGVDVQGFTSDLSLGLFRGLILWKRLGRLRRSGLMRWWRARSTMKHTLRI